SATGMGAARALTAVLTYRLVNFWLILLGGTVLMVILTHAREHRIRHYHRPRRPENHDPEGLSSARAKEPSGSWESEPGAPGG
ncbi:MAG TPA: hypothetical protein VIV12_19675, partial [Streptosporangiaceae bacterium]